MGRGAGRACWPPWPEEHTNASLGQWSLTAGLITSCSPPVSPHHEGRCVSARLRDLSPGPDGRATIEHTVIQNNLICQAREYIYIE